MATDYHLELEANAASELIEVVAGNVHNHTGGAVRRRASSSRSLTHMALEKTLKDVARVVWEVAFRPSPRYEYLKRSKQQHVCTET
jgi:hypothetical protein